MQHAKVESLRLEMSHPILESRPMFWLQNVHAAATNRPVQAPKVRKYIAHLSMMHYPIHLGFDRQPAGIALERFADVPKEYSFLNLRFGSIGLRIYQTCQRVDIDKP